MLQQTGGEGGIGIYAGQDHDHNANLKVGL